MMIVRGFRAIMKRPILAAVLLLIGLVISWVGVEVYIAMTLTPSVEINYGEELRVLVAQGKQEEGDDAWANLIESGAILDDLLESYQFEDTGWDWKASYGFYSITDYDRCGNEIMLSFADKLTSRDKQWVLNRSQEWAVQTIVSMDRLGITERLDRVAEGNFVDIGISDSSDTEKLGPLYIYSDGGTGILPSKELGDSRQLARALHASMFRASQRGDWGRYVLSMEQGLAVGRVWMNLPSSTQRINGQSMRLYSIRQLKGDLVSGVIPPSVIGEIEAAFQRQSGVPSESYTLECERVLYLDAAQRCYSSSGRFVQTEFEARFKSNNQTHPIANINSVWRPRWAEFERNVASQFDKIIKECKLPPAAKQSSSMKQQFAAWPKGGPESLEEHLRSTISMWMRLQTIDRYSFGELGVEVMLAIEQYAFENLEYPEKLADLVPIYLDEIPLDPYSTGGASLMYSRVQDSSGARRYNGHVYKLYSVGSDGEDNGGVHLSEIQEQGSATDWPINRNLKGTDYIINHVESPN